MEYSFVFFRNKSHAHVEIASPLQFEVMFTLYPGADLGGGCRGCAPPPPEMTCGFLIQLVFCKKKKTMWFIGIEIEQETSSPPPKKNPASAPATQKANPICEAPLLRSARRSFAALQKSRQNHHSYV